MEHQSLHLARQLGSGGEPTALHAKHAQQLATEAGGSWSLGTVVLSGGGSGGHITPILAVADELKKRDPDTHIVYIGQTGDNLSDVPRAHPSIDEVLTVRAGKFRRYHGEGWRQLLDIPTVLKNIRDAMYAFIGTLQSYFLLRRLKPSIVFIRGGFVGVPVGLAAAMRKIPYITHDSDAIPSLANRIIARWAAIHAVALPKELYAYSQDKTVYVGVPVSGMYQPVAPRLQHEYRRGLGLSEDARVICVTGGGLGAQRLNEAVAKIAPQLFQRYPNLHILHIAGGNNEADVQELYRVLVPTEQIKRVVIKGFVNDLYRYSAAADIVIARAGATNLAEFAIQHRACIIVPNPVLAGGHQLKNAESLANKGAIRVVHEEGLKDDAKPLLDSITVLLDSSEARHKLSETFGTFAKPDAAAVTADLLVNVAKPHGAV